VLENQTYYLTLHQKNSMPIMK